MYHFSTRSLRILKWSPVIAAALLFSACGGSKPEPTPVPPTAVPPTEAPAATATTPPPTEVITNAVHDLDGVQSAVVQIVAQGTFADPKEFALRTSAGAGSGFFIDDHGTIVTNNHVVTGAAIVKVLVNGETKTAKILGQSECADLAVISIESEDTPYLEWYTDPVKVG